MPEIGEGVGILKDNFTQINGKVKRKMEKTEYIEFLKEKDACKKAIKWSKQFSTAQEAWDKCDNGLWMLWLINNCPTSTIDENWHKKLVYIACGCARLALKYVPEGETRPLKCIETVELYLEGKATIDEVKTAAAGAAAEILKQCANIIRSIWSQTPVNMNDE